MNISYKWLKEYVDFDMTAQEVAEALTSIGLEVGSVDEVQTIRGGLKGLVVGEVLTCEAHPDSDHMHVTTVDLGDGNEPTQVVCGAHNVAAGQKVIVATLGTKLYDGDSEFVIKKSKLRGVESYGMICAEDEIGVGTGHDGIMVLPVDTPVGTPAATYFGLESDFLIEVDITPNRADACSHWGVARDLYAYLVRNGQPTALHRPDDAQFAVAHNDLPIAVEVERPEACLRYCAVTLKGCEIKESPKWLQDKLNTIGLRPINNIVDITNYVMMAYGQPLHCFDADMVAGHKIVVTTQPEGTKFITLDGEEHSLSEKDLSICNANEAMCIAGIFGGKGSGTYENTRNIVLESAYFHPTWIRKSARRHGLSTDASYRFERGIDPNGQVYALKQAAILCKELAGGQVSMQIKDVYPEPIEGSKVVLTYDYVNSLIGKEIGKDTIKSIVTSLDMKIEAENENQIEILVPAYRVDVKRPCDVVEDILRIYGYNNVEIPLQLKGTLTIPTDEDRNRKYINLISEQLVGGGFNEILNNSLTKVSYYKDLNCYTEETTVKILNPLSTDLGVMRQTLLFGGLESIVRNANRKNSNLRFFEFGNCYHYDESKKEADKLIKAYTQDQHLGLWVTGKRVENSWVHPNEDASFYELKAYVENILVRLGLSLQAVTLVKGENNIFEDSISIVTKAGKIIAELGIVAYKLTKNMGITNEVFFADIYWDNLLKAVKKHVVEYKEISKYPAVSRDLALLVDKTVEFEQIKEIAYSTEKKLLKAVELFDIYEGKNLPEGKKSYAVNFILQDEQKTLNDKQIDSIMKKLIDNLTKRLNAELR